MRNDRGRHAAGRPEGNPPGKRAGAAEQAWDWDALVREAFEIGLTLEQFWKLTPRQFVLAREGHRARQGWLAWHVAMLGRCEPRDFPELAELTTGTRPEREPPTPDEQVRILRMWNLVTKQKRPPGPDLNGEPHGDDGADRRAEGDARAG